MEALPEISPHLRLARHVSRLARTLQRRIDPLLDDALGIDGRDLFVLRAVQRGESNPMRLAARLAIAPSSASRILDHLAERGMIERTDDPNDRRKTRLALTDPGRTTARRARQLAEDALHTTYRDVPDGDIERAVEALARLEMGAEPSAPTPAEAVAGARATVVDLHD